MVAALQASHSLTVVCEALGLHRSTVKYRRVAAKRIDPQRIQLNALVRAAHTVNNGSAGARSIAHIVTGQGTPLSRYRATGWIKRLGRVSAQLPKHRYKKAEQPHVAIANTLSREFNPTRPNQVWCGDVTYVWTRQCWSYLAVVLDLYARVPVGWAMSNSPNGTHLENHRESSVVSIRRIVTAHSRGWHPCSRCS
jgi:putative transposase